MDIKRRQFIKGLLLTGLGSMTPALSGCYETIPDMPGGDGLFPASVTSASAEEFEACLEIKEGAIPPDIAGHVFIMESINTPDLTMLSAAKGAVSRLDFVDGSVFLKRKMILTPSVLVKELLDDTSDQFISLGSLVYWHPRLGIVNYCNTAYTRLADGALSMNYDAGVPHLLDPNTLDVISPIGGIKEWNPALPTGLTQMIGRNWTFPFVRSSAHPYYDSHTGEFITVDFTMGLPSARQAAMSSGLYLKIWHLQGPLSNIRVIDSRGKNIYIRGAVHSICVTEKFIVILDTPFSIEPLKFLGIRNQPLPFKPDTRLWIIRRDELRKTSDVVAARLVTIQKEWQHMFADFDDYGDEITLYGATSPATDFSEGLTTGDLNLDGSPIRPELRGMLVAPMDQGELGRIRIKVEAAGASAIVEDSAFTMQEDHGWLIALQAYRNNNRVPDEFTHIYWISFGYHPDLAVQRVWSAYRDYPYRNVPAADMPEDTIPPSLYCWDCKAMRISDSWRAPEGVFIASPQFVPSTNSAAQNEGYLTVLAISDEGDEIWLFDAGNLSRGPICKLTHEKMDFAFSLHSVWMEELPATNLDYRVAASVDLEAVVDTLPQSLRNIFENEIYPRFG